RDAVQRYRRSERVRVVVDPPARDVCRRGPDIRDLEPIIADRAVAARPRRYFGDDERRRPARGRGDGQRKRGRRVWRRTDGGIVDDDQYVVDGLGTAAQMRASPQIQ